jgi:hypothetical protein
MINAFIVGYKILIFWLISHAIHKTGIELAAQRFKFQSILRCPNLFRFTVTLKRKTSGLPESPHIATH